MKICSVTKNVKNAGAINSFFILLSFMVCFLMPFQVMAEDDFSASLSDLNQTIPRGKQNDLPWGRDPFIPPPFGITDTEKDFDLTAILYSSKEPTAVINKKIVKVNDNIGNQKIVDIKKDYVILQHDGRSFRLELLDLIKNPNDIKAMR